MRFKPGCSLALLIGFVIVGCGDSDENADDAALAEGNARGAAAQQQIEHDFTGVDAGAQMAMAGAILLTIDDGEIMEAQAALPLLRDSKSIGFANQMVAEHTQHRSDTEAMLANLGIAPEDSGTVSMLRTEAADAVRNIQASSHPDPVYMQVQVTGHQEALMIVSRLDTHIDEPTFDAFLKSTASVISAHRDDASAILRDL